MTVTLSSTAKDLVRTSFIGKDWQTYVDEVNGFIMAVFPVELYNALFASDTGQLLIESTAYALSTLSWFVDRQAGETYVETAQIPTFLARLVRLIGYRPSGAVPSAGTIEVSLPVAQVFPVVIDRGSQLSGPGGNVYETSDVLIFLVGEQGPKSVGVVEGTTTEDVFTSNGQAGQRFRLARIPTGQYIAQGSAEVLVGGVPYTVVPFLDYGQTDQVDVAYGETPPDGPSMFFGDGIAGNIPPAGAEIRITYRSTLGVAGVAAPNTITSFKTPIVASFQVVPVEVTNSQATGAGSDPDVPEKTRALSVSVFKTAERAVTLGDYTALVQSFIDPNYGSVAVGRAVTARSFVEDAETRTIFELMRTFFGVLTPGQQAQYDILVARLETHWNEVLSASCKANLVAAQVLQRDANGVLVAPNVNLAQAVKTSLDGKKEATVAVSVTDGSINLWTVDTLVQVGVLTGYDRATVESDVTAAVASYLTDKEFGDAARLDELYSTLKAITGVAAINLEYTAVQNVTTGQVDFTKIDSFGNVIMQTYEVMTLGTTTVESI